MSPRSLLRLTLLLSLLLATLSGVAQSSVPTFTITTSNATLSTTGTVSIPYTLTSVNGYTGTVVVTCTAPTVPAGVRIPYCVVPSSATNCDPTLTNPPPANVCGLKANQVFTSSFSLNSTGLAATSGFLASRNPALAILFVVVLLAGLTLRRKTARRLTLPLFLCALAGLSCIVGCGNVAQGFTPGTYTYVVGATQSPVPLYIGANASVTIH